MLIKSITTLALVVAFTSVSANEVQSRFILGVKGDQETREPGKPIIWTPISGQLSRFTLTLPKYGIREAEKYQDTTSLYYLSDVEDNGLSLVNDINGMFDFYLKPGLSVYHYRRSITPALSLGAGAKIGDDENRPILTGEYRSVSNDLSVQRNYLELSDSVFNLMIERTELSSNENLEKIWSVAFSSSHTRMSYGWRWFDVIGEENLLAEIGLIDEELVVGWQIERPFVSTIAYLVVAHDPCPGQQGAVLVAVALIAIEVLGCSFGEDCDRFADDWDEAEDPGLEPATHFR